MKKIPKGISNAILKSLGAGVVPFKGLEHIAVGRKREIDVFIKSFEILKEGGADFKFISGRFGSGKSFMLHFIRSLAIKNNFVVSEVDLTKEKLFTGSSGQGINTYKEIINNLSTKACQDGNALPSILEKWISNEKSKVVAEKDISDDDQLNNLVQKKIFETVNQMENLINGFDFAKIINNYWKGYLENDSEMKSNSLKWLRGEITTKNEAKKLLNIGLVVDDKNYYDYIKLLANFVSSVGYNGLIILIDEVATLYTITHSQSRNNNYEKVLAILNETLQGRTEHIGIYMGITPEALTDDRRGIFSNKALKTRLDTTSIIKKAYNNVSGPVIELKKLSIEETFTLLKKLTEIHSLHYKYENKITDKNIESYLIEINKKLGAEDLSTPRELIRNYLAILDYLYENSNISFNDAIGNEKIVNINTKKNKNDTDDEFSEFSL